MSGREKKCKNLKLMRLGRNERAGCLIVVKNEGEAKEGKLESRTDRKEAGGKWQGRQTRRESLRNKVKCL